MKKIIICLVCMAVVVGGCGRKAHEKKAEKELKKALEEQYGGNAEVSIDKENMTINAPGGKMKISSGKDAKLPESFPSDIYIHKGVTVKMAMQSPRGYNTLLRTKESIEDMLEIYKKKMVANGWVKNSFLDMGEQKMISYNKGNRTAAIIITKDTDGVTLVQLATTIKK